MDLKGCNFYKKYSYYFYKTLFVVVLYLYIIIIILTNLYHIPTVFKGIAVNVPTYVLINLNSEQRKSKIDVEI